LVKLIQVPKLFVLDDEVEYHHLYSEFFKLYYSHGRYDGASDKSEALLKIKRSQPHLIIVDLNLGISAKDEIISGEDMAQRIRSNIKMRRRPYIVAASAYFFNTKTERRLIEAGFDEFLAKPWSFEQITKLYHSVFGQTPPVI
jgi:CheY-like chemotaxis protein